MSTTTNPPTDPPPAEETSRSLLKTVFQSSGIYMVALFMSRLAGLILVPIVTHYLAPSDYGVMDLLEQIGTVTSVLLGANIAAALGYFYFQPDANKSRVVGTVFSGALILGSVAMVVGFLLADPISRSILPTPDHKIYLLIVFATMPLSFLVEAGISWVRTENRTKLFTLASLARMVAVIITTIVLVAFLGFKIAGVLMASLTGIIVGTVLTCVTAYRSHGLTFDWKLFIRMAKFAMPLALSGMAIYTVHFGDRFILPYYTSFDEMGLYAVATRFGMLISVIYGAFQYYWAAQVYKIVQRTDAQPMFGKLFTYIMLVITFSALGVLVAATPAVRLMTAPGYHGATALVPIILAAYFLRTVGDFFRPLFLANGKPIYDTVCNWSGAGVCLGCYFWLIPGYGVTGAAAATFISFLVIGTMASIGAYRLWPYQLEISRLVKVFGIGVGLAGIHFLLPDTTIAWQIAQGSVLLLAFLVLLVVSGFLSPSEREMLWSLPQRVRKMIGGGEVSAG